ncbi:DUF3857 domain-containing protein [Thalassotalea sp. HSM 43]|uniref:DUF3857 domain-containing transglutaminase family protein n=1 Tax=Thalassotalea sp. HSM 43 TaxID=2552945 RepID=UPI00108089C1|nr:DUF3857 domain-containing protein [Thalassotalea sp. HSM 43]QBY04650.1 DUF3857 domain-containing protein [Thalassotalea sp. HSM 43]
MSLTRKTLAPMLCAIICLLASSNQVFAKDAPIKQSTPAWVDQFSLDSEVEKSPFEQLTYLLLDRQVNNTLEQKQKYYRYSYRLNNTSGVAENADIRISFAPDYETLLIHQINIIRNGKVIDKLDMSKIRVVNDETEQDSQILNGQVAALLVLEDARVGDIIDYSFTIEGSNPVFKDNFSYISGLGWSIAINQVRYRFILDKDMPIYSKVSDSSVEIKTIPHPTHKVLAVDLANTKKRHMDDNAPSWHNPYPYLQLSSYQSWNQVALWADDLFSVKPDSNSELATYINELKQLPSEQAIDSAITFVQDEVRYFGIEIAENSHLPHAPNEVFNNRYGDCKDKTLLLTTIFRELGIEASPALVSTDMQHNVRDYLPTHSLFNHVIVKAEVDGKQYWIDPTINYQGGSYQSLHQPDYGIALIVDPQTSQLSDAKPTMNNLSEVTIEEKKIVVDYFSPISWQITTTFTNREAEYLRYRLASSGVDELERQYLNYYAKKHPLIVSAKPMQINDDRDNNRITLTEQYLVPEYWHYSEQDAEFSLVADYLASYVNPPTTVKRQDPFWLHWPLNVDHKVSMQFPEFIQFGDMENVAVNNDYFSFSAVLTQDSRTLTYHTKYRNHKNHIEAQDAGMFVRDINEVDDYLGYYRSILQVMQDPGINEMQTLMEMLNEKSMGSE